jgi:REP element-mobilizing transposase RayT
MYLISRTTPVYYLTSVTHNRLPIFRTDKVKEVVCKALDEARKSGGFLIFAYVVMPDHLHLLTDNARPTTDTLRYTNGIAAKRVIDYLKENNFESCLAKLRIQVRDREHKHSVFQHHPNAFEIYGEDKMMEKVNYIHLNPVRAKLVKIPDDYRFSSSRQWRGKETEDEPLLTDHRQIKWRSK